MEILLPILLIGGGLACIFYIRPKLNDKITEIKFMQTKSIKELKEMFSQMEESGLGNEYREYVELKGNVSGNEVDTTFSNKKVAYCESKLMQVSEVREQYRDQNGNMQTRTRKVENTISDEKSSQDISMKDSSIDEEIVLEINANGCQLDIPKTFDRFEPKNNLSGYRFFNGFSMGKYGAETLGFKMVEKTISMGQNLYVIGEAFKVGNQIHIGKPQDGKKPFIVTTKSEEDLVNQSKSNSTIALVGGIALAIIGIIILIKNFI